MADEIFERAWGHYITMLEKLINSGTPKDGVFQPFNLATLLPYNKDKKNYNNFLLYNASNFVAPTMPSYSNEKINEQKLEHPSKLEEAYANFLDEFNDLLVDALSSERRKNYDTMKKELSASQTELSNYAIFVNDEWNKYRVRNNIPADRLESERIIFEREYGYSMQIDRYKEETKRINVRINAFLKSNTPRELWRLVDSKAYFDDPNYSVDLPPSGTFDDNSMRQYWRKFRMQFPILDLEEFLSNDNNISRNFDTKSEDYSRVETTWKVKTKARWGIFSGGGSAERRKMEEISNKNHFAFDISFKRFEEVEIFRDKWFQDSLFASIGKKFPQYWGPNGIMGAIPYSLILARGTTISVTIDDEYRKTLEQFVSGGGSFGFGSFFSIGGDYRKDEKYMNFNSTTNKFTISDGEKTIRIIGARVKRHNWNDEFYKEYYDEINEEIIKSAYEVLEKALKK